MRAHETEEGDLLPGVYRATPSEVLKRFGQGRTQRRVMADQRDRLRKRSGADLLDSGPCWFSPSGASIAVAAVHNIDYLLTWNCKHSANAQITRRIALVCERLGQRMPIICTPEELMGE